MRHKTFMAAVLLATTTTLGGCVAYSDYGYSAGPGYYARNPGGPAYYAGDYPYRYHPFYTPDYNGYYDTYRNSGGGDN